MKLIELIASSGIEAGTDGIDEKDITLVTEESERVTPNSVFVCVNGKNYNGHLKAKEALSKGVPLVIGEENLDIPNYIRTENAREAFGKLSRAYFGFPDKKLCLVGITGTNGKTTTAEYIRFILNRSGRKCGVIGTLGWDCGTKRVPSERTTPDSFTFYSELKRTAENGCGCCVAEISSQALDQSRVNAAEFDLAILTNIGHDHLDYHKTARNYVEAKKKLFTLSSAALINADDAYRDEFAAAFTGKKCKLFSAGMNLADYSARNIKSDARGGSSYILFDGNRLERVYVSAPGKIGIYNTLCAASASMMLGTDISVTAKALEELPDVNGRCEMITSEDGIRVCVDFAHTPEALGSILSALGETASGKIITVFGCGGDRDATKRPVMGRIAMSLSDCVILTSDNPRNEDPEKIISDISSGIRNKAYLFREPDRRRAIMLALNKASCGDTVLIAGKGHETTQLSDGVTEHFSDAEAVREILGITKQ